MRVCYGEIPGDVEKFMMLNDMWFEKEICMTRPDKVNGIRDFPTTGHFVGTLAGTR